MSRFTLEAAFSWVILHSQHRGVSVAQMSHNARNQLFEAVRVSRIELFCSALQSGPACNNLSELSIEIGKKFDVKLCAES